MSKDLESRIIMHRGDSASRKIWKGIVIFTTWWIPTFCLKYCGGMRREDVRQAWREKVTLFSMCCLASSALLFVIIGVPRIVCPKTNIKDLYEIQAINNNGGNYVAAYGRYFDVSDISANHINKIGVDELQMEKIFTSYYDVSQMFYPATTWDTSCPGITNPGATWDNFVQRDTTHLYPHTQSDPTTGKPEDYMGELGKYSKGRIGWKPEVIAGINDPNMKVITINGKVYNVAAYFNAQTKPGFFDDNMYNIFTNVGEGKDASGFMNTLLAQNPVYYRNVVNCMDHIFYIGVIDERGAFKCTIANTIMLGASAIVCLVIGIKFLAAWTTGDSTNPAQINKYVMVQVPCYTEDRASLELTINSIATTRFDDAYKLAVILCDGNITGGGNNKPTPDIVLEILYGSEEAAEAAKAEARPPMSYHAVGEGRKAENKAQVYSGRYACEGHNLPFIVIVKMGTENEKFKPGNRGKRDSQILLMRFLDSFYGRKPFTEMEYALYNEMRNSLGMSPEKFEFMLMVDADTSITKESITKLVYHMIKDEDTIGLCGETLVANENQSWTTRIQPYEYFISHHMAKAFESMFGSVTCLPGCFCMYRIRTEKNVPILAAPALIEDYAVCNVDTLHKKNLLSLGEDRYLTTLILKHFRGKKTKYTQDAQCHSTVPDNFGVLQSQRRRWINSTVHNLVELVNLEQLCGFCCFSMRFVVFLDLISCIVAPAAVCYVIYLFYTIIFENSTTYMVSLIMIAAIYGLQLIIIVLKMKWAFIVYMLFYMLAMPYFSCFLPLYSFWKMDEFSWGNTRVVVGNGREEDLHENFDVASIPKKRISEWEQLWKAHGDEDEIAFKDCVKPQAYNTNIDAYPIAPQMTHPMMPARAMSGHAQSAYGMPQSNWGGSQYGGSGIHMTAASTVTPSQMGQSRMGTGVHGMAPIGMTSPLNTYAPSHILSYVGNQYPVPSTYAPSSFAADDADDCQDTEESARKKKERREKRKLRRREKELRALNAANAASAVHEAQAVPAKEEHPEIQQVTHTIDLPKVDDNVAGSGWGLMNSYISL